MPPLYRLSVQGGRAKGRGNQDDDSDFEDGPSKKTSKAKGKAAPPPPPPSRAIVPELVLSAGGGKVGVSSRSYRLEPYKQNFLHAACK